MAGDQEDDFPTRPGLPGRRMRERARERAGEGGNGHDSDFELGKIMRRVAKHDDEIPDLRTQLNELHGELQDTRDELNDRLDGVLEEIRGYRQGTELDMRSVSRGTALRSSGLTGALSLLVMLLWRLLDALGPHR